MKYYKLWLALEEEDALLEAGPSLKPPFTNWVGGVPWKKPVPDPVDIVVQKPGQMLPFFNMPVPLMRPAMLAALRGAGVSNLVDYPALVHDPVSGSSWNDYRAVNVVGVIAAVDQGRSDGDALDPETDVGTFFDRVVIDPAKAGDALMFRLSENLSYIVVAEPVKASLMAMADTRGLRFTPLNGEEDEDEDDEDEDEDEDD